MLMILARLVRSESFWAVVKVRSPHTGPGGRAREAERERPRRKTVFIRRRLVLAFSTREKPPSDECVCVWMLLRWKVEGRIGWNK